MSSMKRHIEAMVAGDWTEELGRAAYEASLQSPETSQRLAELVAK